MARARKQAGAAEEAALRLGDDCELDVGDAGSRRTAVEEERRRADEARSAVQRAEAALRRLDEGAFGRCVSCGA
ncbi:TraR/DksA family transcriptional regulator, partial [Streptomyces sp. SID8455]|nr:TraR/DksA family transcriptional regulator [Streptomyces sp. SID8455]